MESASIIIMDEHPLVRMAIEVLLQKNDHNQIVLNTNDGHEVLRFLRNQPVDLVILDIDLPGSDGFSFLKRIKDVQ